MQNFCHACISKLKNFLVFFDRESSTQRTSQIVSTPKVIIIGAGAAGLACAVRLLECGFNNVVVLEAENRIGGRIHTVPFGDNVIDIGAQFVHGERDNVVYEMVEHLNLLETSGDIYTSFDCIRSNGVIVSESIVEQLKNIFVDIYVDKYKQMSEFSGSLGEFLRINFFNALNEEPFNHIPKDIAEEFFENFKRMESTESSLELDEVSARGVSQNWECRGDYLLNWKDKGFENFLHVLTETKKGSANMNGILESKIIFGSKVTKIDWNREDGLIEVLCEKKQQSYMADHVVLTVSLGVLKKHADTLFHPALPEDKLEAIHGIGFGNVLKIFLEFPYRFWVEKWTGFTTLWLEKDVQELEANNVKWLQEFYGFYTVPNQPRILEAWVVGYETTKIEQMPSSELEFHITALLRRFLRTIYDVPNLKNLRISTWGTNNNFYGSYSFRTLKTEEVGTGASALAQPLFTMLTGSLLLSSELKDDNASIQSSPSHKPAIFFAGEATSAHHFSTVHGAVESGWREAKRLVGCYRFET